MKSVTIRTFVFAGLIAGVFLVQAAAEDRIHCWVNAVDSTPLRAEGHTEQVGDIFLSCTGGTPTPFGVPVPTYDMSVLMTAQITSRIYANGWSEVLLIIDEPPVGTDPFVSAHSTQLACADASGVCTVTGTGTGLGTYDGSAGRPNIFPGKVSGNIVTFSSVPVDPPAVSKFRVLRITNLRINADQLAIGFPSTVAVSPVLLAGGLPIDRAQPTAGYIQYSADFSLRSPDNASAANSSGFAVSQCGAPQRVAVFRAAELMDSAFRKRTIAAFVDSETSPTPAVQNTPGGIYNAETGFYNPALTAPTVNFATVGLGDAGTRLRAVIDNIPLGSKVFVSTKNVIFSGGNPLTATTGLLARLVQNEATAFVPMAATATLEGVPVTQLQVVAGKATAVWEVLSTDPNALENLDFAIWAQSADTAGTGRLTPSYAPAAPAFEALGSGSASSTLPLPRFVSIFTPSPLFSTTNTCANPASTSTTLAAAPAGPNRYTLTATVTTPDPATWGVPLGNVTFYDNGSAIAGSTTAVNATGTASFTAGLASAAHVLTVTFTPTDSQSFTASTSAGVSLTVPAAATSTAVAAAPAGGTNQYSLTATVSTPAQAITGAAAGTVTFYDSGASIAAVPTGAGTATFVATLASGAHSLTATFTPANAAVFAASTSSSLPLTVGRVATSIQITSSLNPSLPGQAVTFTATLSSASGTPGGSLKFTDGSLSLGSVPLSGGSASVTVTFTTVGVHDIFATYDGDTDYVNSSARYGQRVDRMTGSLALAASAGRVSFGQPETLTATLTSPAPAGVPAATGTVQFQEGASVIGTASMASGAAVLAISNLSAGTHQIVAVYSGDANWYGTHSTAVAVMVTVSSTSTTLTSAATISEVRMIAALSPAASSGSVQFLDTAVNFALGTSPVVNGTATLVLTPAAAVKIAGHAITAVFSGSDGYAGSTSNSLALPGMANAAAGSSTALAADELVSMFGRNLADAAQTPDSATLPLSLGGVSVNVADSTGAVFACPLSYVSPSQINFLIPAGIAPGAALVTVLRGSDLVAAMPSTISRVAPGLFAVSQMRADGAVYLVLYATGVRHRSDAAAVSCVVNGTALPVLYAGAQPDFAGLDQVNVQLPAGLSGAGTLNVSLMVDGQPSNAVTVTIP